MIDDDDMSIIYPARIVNYYPATQTADIKISAERVRSSVNQLLKIEGRQLIEDVPVHTPYGGGWSMTFPIKTGDTCLICFSQIGYDHWFIQDRDTGGTIATQPVPHLRRQFSEDDGFAMVGFNTKPRAIQSYHPTHSQWRDEDASQVISLNDNETITITSPVSLTVNAPSVVINCDTADINASTNVTIDSPLTKITGDLEMIDGDFTMTNGVFTDQGISYIDHRHPENDNGGPTDGPISGL